ncbi:MAG TPA: hypothetical protein VKB96_14515, partial [Gammaproteobacteria bacterium]|nr:hypothetical protein [Gammaproteobacteria bacterium]
MIEAVHVRQSLIEKLLGFGTIGRYRVIDVAQACDQRCWRRFLGWSVAVLAKYHNGEEQQKGKQQMLHLNLLRRQSMPAMVVT